MKGKNYNSIIDGKIESLRRRIDTTQRNIEDYQKRIGEVAKSNLEVSLIIPRIANLLANEIEIIISNKKALEDEKRNRLSDSQLKDVTKKLSAIIERKYLSEGLTQTEKQFSTLSMLHCLLIHSRILKARQ